MGTKRGQISKRTASDLGRLIPVLLVVLVFLCFSSAAQSEQGGTFEVYALGQGVNMPFPQQPSRVGSVEQEGVTQDQYRFAHEESGIGFTATVMRGEIDSSSGPQTILKGYVNGVVDVMGGRIVSAEPHSIAGLPVRIVVVQMEQQNVKVRSHTVAVFDQGQVHSWAIQDFPELTGDVAKTMFERNLNKISVDRNRRTK